MTLLAFLAFWRGLDFMAVNGPTHGTFGGHDFARDPDWIGGALAGISGPMPAMAEVAIHRRDAQVQDQRRPFPGR